MKKIYELIEQKKEKQIEELCELINKNFPKLFDEIDKFVPLEMNFTFIKETMLYKKELESYNQGYNGNINIEEWICNYNSYTKQRLTKQTAKINSLKKEYIKQQKFVIFKNKIKNLEKTIEHEEEILHKLKQQFKIDIDVLKTQLEKEFKYLNPSNSENEIFQLSMFEKRSIDTLEQNLISNIKTSLSKTYEQINFILEEAVLKIKHFYLDPFDYGILHNFINEIFNYEPFIDAFFSQNKNLCIDIFIRYFFTINYSNIVVQFEPYISEITNIDIKFFWTNLTPFITMQESKKFINLKNEVFIIKEKQENKSSNHDIVDIIIKNYDEEISEEIKINLLQKQLSLEEKEYWIQKMLEEVVMKKMLGSSEKIDWDSIKILKDKVYKNRNLEEYESLINFLPFKINLDGSISKTQQLYKNSKYISTGEFTTEVIENIYNNDKELFFKLYQFEE